MKNNFQKFVKSLPADSETSGSDNASYRSAFFERLKIKYKKRFYLDLFILLAVMNLLILYVCTGIMH